MVEYINTPVTRLGRTKKIIASNKILDIGIALFVDESKDFRRILNGQLISISKFGTFVKELKKVATLYPTILTTEENWQSIVTMSKNGQCGKFVIDETVGTVRLPKITIFISNLTDLTQLGDLVNDSLPNVKGLTYIRTSGENLDTFIHNSNVSSESSGALPYGGLVTWKDAGSHGVINSSLKTLAKVQELKLNASLSSPTYKDGASVHEEAVQYPYYIQVANDADITGEIQINNPFFFGMSQYFEIEPNNASWLKSTGQWNQKDTYKDYYNWILTNVNNGIFGFKTHKGNAYTYAGNYICYYNDTQPKIGGIVYTSYTNFLSIAGIIQSITSDGFTFKGTLTGNVVTAVRNSSADITDGSWITDYDYVINTEDETFRLPLLDGSETLPSDDFQNLDSSLISVGTSSNIAVPFNGYMLLRVNKLTGANSMIRLETQGQASYATSPSSGTATAGVSIFCKAGSTVNVGVFGSFENITNFQFYKAKGNGSLYFYVGEVLQDANLINAGNVLNRISQLNNEYITALAFPSNSRIHLTLGSSGSSYVMPADGYLNWNGSFTSTSGYLRLSGKISSCVYSASVSPGQPYRTFIPVSKDESVNITHSSIKETFTFDFIYATGAV